MKAIIVLRYIVVFSLLIYLTACATLSRQAGQAETEGPILSEADKISPEAVDMEMIFDENRGLPVLKENALTFHDYYRGAVQRKEEAEVLLEKGELLEAEKLFLESIQWLEVVRKINGEDNINFPVYHHTAIRYLPNFLIGHNYFKLAIISQKQGMTSKASSYNQNSVVFLKESIAMQPFSMALNTIKEVEQQSGRVQ